MSRTLYQKYRPNTFSDVIGQAEIITILENSIKSNDIQNTYLFSGPRGTGKTSIAKIFARALNCTCDILLKGECDNCQYFKEVSEYDDIFELDAASNNGVEDIRNIIENCYFNPTRLKKKIYIIDEVHMLSKGAFNALLKTLEEPPVHVVFILATTEVNKIPATILSRCQRFDFKRVRNDVLKKHLSNIIELENIENENYDFKEIIDMSDGCVRDALSLLQKVITSESKINKELVLKRLNLLNIDEYDKLLELLLLKNSDKILKYFNELYENGLDEMGFIKSYQTYLKNKILEENNNDRNLIELVYKINDLENRAVYTSNLKNLIDVVFLDYCLIKKDVRKLENTLQKESMNIDTIKKPEYDSKKTNEVKKENKKTEDNYIENKQKETKKGKNNFDIDDIFGILKNATKDMRINVCKKFIKSGDELTIEKKRGLAKFFIDADVKAANQNSVIVTIDDSFVEAFNERKEDLLKIVKLEKMYILTKKEWINIRTSFLEKKEIKEPIDDNIVKTIEAKLGMDVEIL